MRGDMAFTVSYTFFVIKTKHNITKLLVYAYCWKLDEKISSTDSMAAINLPLDDRYAMT